MNVLMVTPNDFPAEDAGAVRDDAFSQLFQRLGYEVYCLSRGRTRSQGVYRGAHFQSTYRARGGLLCRNWNRLLAPLRFQRTFFQHVAAHGAPALLYTDYDDNRIVRFLQRYARRENVPLLYGACEWYSPCEFRLGRLNKSYLLNDWQNRHVLQKPSRIIAISRYLETHFRARGLAVLRVPVILDMAEIDGSVAREDGPVNLVYAGSPGGKDSLRPALLALLSLPEEARARLRLHVIGVDGAQLAALCGISETAMAALGESLCVYGRLPHAEVLRRLKTMDLSLLLRAADERYAKAGFPTKAVEAMAHGVAMLCNLSSDLGEYLIDGENALLAADDGEDAVRTALLRAAALTDAEIVRMRRAARALAEREFDFGKYVFPVKQFLLPEERPCR